MPQRNHYAVILIFVLSLLTSCSGESSAQPVEAEPRPESNAAPSTSTATPEPTRESIATDPRGQTIVFWHIWEDGPISDGMASIVDEFNATNQWGITVKSLGLGSQSKLESAVNEGITTDELPNAVIGFPSSISNWFLSGAVIPIGDYVLDPVYGLSEHEINAIYPGSYAAGILADGAQIGIPFHQSAYVIYYNHTWAQELGFDSPPENITQFQQQACAAADANTVDDDPANDGTGGYVLFTGASNIFSWVFAFGGDIVDQSGEAYLLNSKVVKDVALFLRDLIAQGCAFETEGFGYPDVEFATRKALFISGSTAGFPYQRQVFEQQGNSDIWGFIPFPGPDGNQAVNAFIQLGSVLDTTPESNLASWIWLRYLTSPEVQAEWIRYSSYLPSQSATLSLLADFADDNPIYATGLSLGEYGKPEPNFPANQMVRRTIQDAFSEIMDAQDEAVIDDTLTDLQETAEELFALSQ